LVAGSTKSASKSTAGQSIEQGLVKLAATGPEAPRSELLRLVMRQQVGDFETALREFRDRLGEVLLHRRGVVQR